MGDSKDAADISAVSVGNDFVTGNYVVWVDLSNRSSLTGNDAVVVWFDADLNPTNNDGGLDYQIDFDANNNCALYQWQGSRYGTVPSPSLRCDFSGHSVRIEVSPSDLGGSKAFTFFVSTYVGDTEGDIAPDGNAIYTYSAKSGQLALTFARVAFAPTTPKAGKAFAAAFVITREDIGERLEDGTVICVLKLAGKTVPARVADLVDGTPTCAWQIPKKAKGKTVVATMGMSYGGSTLVKSFVGKVH